MAHSHGDFPLFSEETEETDSLEAANEINKVEFCSDNVSRRSHSLTDQIMRADTPHQPPMYGGRSLTIREWLTTEQAAEYLGLSVGALRNMTSNGSVPYHKLGRRNRYNVVELRQLLLSGKRGGQHGY